MANSTTAIAFTLAYMVGVGILSVAIGRPTSAKGFAEGGHYPTALIGVVLLSEFIGAAVSVGTAELGYTKGISAAWNVVALAIGFVLLGLVLAPKYKQLGINTISGVLGHRYGEPTRLASSAVTVCALQIISVSIVASSGAVLSSILGINQSTAVIVLSLATAFYVTVGGMRSVIYTNLVHGAIKYAGIVIAVVFGFTQLGGVHVLASKLPAAMFAWDTVGWGQIGGWIVAGVGSIFATQQTVQALHTSNTVASARQASFYCAALIVPFGVGAALVGMLAAALHPGINPLRAFPSLIADMDGLSASVVVAGLAASLFGAVSAASMGTATLFVRDFVDPAFNRSRNERRSVWALRLAAILFCLLPMVLAISASNILAIAYLGKALRSSLAVLVLLAFYAPGFGSGAGALSGLFLSLVATVAWFLMGNPFGIDNAYVAASMPLLTMAISALPIARSRRAAPLHASDQARL